MLNQWVVQDAMKQAMRWVTTLPGVQVPAFWVCAALVPDDDDSLESWMVANTGYGGSHDKHAAEYMCSAVWDRCRGFTAAFQYSTQTFTSLSFPQAEVLHERGAYAEYCGDSKLVVAVVADSVEDARFLVALIAAKALHLVAKRIAAVAQPA